MIGVFSCYREIIAHSNIENVVVNSYLGNSGAEMKYGRKFDKEFMRDIIRLRYFVNRKVKQE